MHVTRNPEIVVNESVSKTHSIQQHNDLTHPDPVDKLVQEAAKQPLQNSSPSEELNQHKWGEVIVLVGTSSAGKSSIISELRKHKPDIIESGIDISGVQILLAFFDKHHPDEM